jgi:phytoene synthase
MTGDVESELPFYPDIRDPRVMVAVPHARRAAVGALWALAGRLTRLLDEAREPLIGQIKLAWWRDMMALLATDPAALPKGEPLLAELQASWAGRGGLDALVDAAEAVLLAETADARREAAGDFGERLFALSAAGAAGAGGRRWGLLWGAVRQTEAEAAETLFAAARDLPFSRAAFAGERALLLLDRWAAMIAAVRGERRWRSEGLMLFRVGLLGR